MADISAVPVQNFGQDIMSIPTAMSDIASQAQTRQVQQAQIPGINAQTQGTQLANQGAAIANQRAALTAAWLQHAMAAPILNDSQTGTPDATTSAGGQPVPSVAAGNGEAPDTDGSLTPDEAFALHASGVDAMAQNKYAVKDIWSPQELQALAQQPQNILAGLPDQTANIKTQHEARIANMTASAQLAASNAYDANYALANAPDGTALNMLKRMKPNAVAGQTGADAAATIEQLAKKYNWSPEETDQYVRDFATESANAIRTVLLETSRHSSLYPARTRPGYQPRNGRT
jgi:hypothetical protein